MRYTGEELAWLKDKWENSSLTLKEIHKAFGELFPSHKIGVVGLWDAMKRNSFVRDMAKKRELHRQKIREASAKKATFYTNEQLEWVKDKWGNTDLSFAKIAEEFNKAFPDRPPVTRYCLTKIVYRNKFVRSPELKMSAYRKRNNGKRTAPEGAEIVRNGKVYVKTNSMGGRYRYRTWIPKRQMVWEKANNKKLPFGWVVVQLDGDEDNYDPSNLCACSKKTWSALHFYETRFKDFRKACGAEWTRVYLMTQELKVALEENGVKV